MVTKTISTDLQDPIDKNSLEPIKDLKNLFEKIHNYVYVNEGFLKEKVFQEILKLILIKIMDENSRDTKCGFYISSKEKTDVLSGKGSIFLNRIFSIFDSVKTSFPDNFNEFEKINLSPSTLSYLVEFLQKFSFTKTPADVKGVAFQTFVYAHFRGARGEFFTPYPVVQLCIEMLQPMKNEKILDPACGSGGFLIEILKHFPKIKKQNFKKSDGLWGIDINPDLIAVSKTQLMLYGYPKPRHVVGNSLKENFIFNNQENFHDSFDVVMTNPPFGIRAKIMEPNILRNYQLGHKWIKDKNNNWKVSKKLLSAQSADILFIEKCLKFLKPNGRMAILIPDGILKNISLGYVRDFIKTNSRILAVVSLPEQTFSPYGTNAKASVLFLQKSKIKTKSKIFMAVSQNVGYDQRGKILFSNNINTLSSAKDLDTLISSSELIETDIPNICEKFKKFRQKEGIKFT